MSAIFINMRTDILDRKEDLLLWIRENKTKSFISQQLQCKQQTLNQYLKQMGSDYSGNMAGLGLLKSKVKMVDILSNKVTFTDGPLLRKRLIHEGLIEDKCCECNNLGYWNNNPLTLELDHINGDNNDNRLENLRLLCPNCHSQTPTFRKKKSSLNKEN